MKLTKLVLFISFVISFYSDSENKQELNSSKSRKTPITQEISEDCTQLISGTIFDSETLLPVPSALVTLYLNEEEITLVKVNSKGEYSIMLNCDTPYKITVSSDNYFNSIFKLNTSSKSNWKISQDFYLKKTCYQTITGSIINELSNEIVNKATVTLYLNGDAIKSLKVGDDGKYTFTIKCNKNYYIIVNKLNFINDIYEFTTSTKAGEIINHNFILEPECVQTISGIVLNKVTNEPINAEIKLYLNNIEVEKIKVNNDGNYSIKFQCTTNYRIIAEKPNYKVDSYNFLTDFVQEKQPDYFHIKKDLFLEPNECFQVVLGKVLDKNTNKIIPNSTVSLIYEGLEIKTFQTNFDGFYFFNVKCNLNYEIKASKDSMISETIKYQTFSVKDEKKIKNIYLKEESCNQVVNGTVFDKNTNLPLASTQITLYKDNEEINNTITRSNGTFSFNLNCESIYKIVANKNEYNEGSILFETDKTRNKTLTETLEILPLDCNQVVNGTVFDKKTNLPLTSTQITLFENNIEINKTTTDSNGAFSFNLNCESTYKIVANNQLYTLEFINLTTSKIRNTINNLTLNLSKKECKQTVTGIIRDSVTKKPLPNTTISLYQNNKVIDTYTVGDDGVYKFKLNCSSIYKLSIFKNNYLESFNLRTVSQNNRILTLHIDIEPLICIQYINGIVKENISKNPIPNAKVILHSNSTKIKESTTDSNGSFYFEIDSNKTYNVLVEKQNYTTSDYNLISTTHSAFPHNIKLVIEPIIKFKEKKGVKYIETKPLAFELNEYQISNYIKPELNKVIFSMNQNPTIKIEVNFYTDSRGPDDYNLQLTTNRANATKDYLILNGINPERIEINGYGETKLLNKCKNNIKCTDAEHAINRRSEFIVINNKKPLNEN